MKKMFLAATMFVAMTLASFANAKNSDEKILNDLKTALKSVNQSAWVTTDSYQRASFSLNGKEVHAYINAEDGNLIGFSIAIETSSLPDGAMNNLSKKFNGWQILNPIMFIDQNGDISYYVQANKGKSSLALHVYDNGKVSIYNKIMH
jgi:hypothetical protein